MVQHRRGQWQRARAGIATAGRKFDDDRADRRSATARERMDETESALRCPELNADCKLPYSPRHSYLVISNPTSSGEKSALFRGREKQISLFVRNDNTILLKVAARRRSINEIRTAHPVPNIATAPAASWPWRSCRCGCASSIAPEAPRSGTHARSGRVARL